MQLESRSNNTTHLYQKTHHHPLWFSCFHKQNIESHSSSEVACYIEIIDPFKTQPAKNLNIKHWNCKDITLTSEATTCHEITSSTQQKTNNLNYFSMTQTQLNNGDWLKLMLRLITSNFNEVRVMPYHQHYNQNDEINIHHNTSTT